MVGSGQSEMLSNSNTFVYGVKAHGAYELNSMKFHIQLNSSVVVGYFDFTSDSWEKYC
jgi:hypothetical protein